MNAVALPHPCRIPGCGQPVPATLAAESFCTDHFLEHAFRCAQQSLERCQRALPLDPRTIDWLFSSATFRAGLLTRDNSGLEESQRASLLELLLYLANLREYVDHHSVELTRSE